MRLITLSLFTGVLLLGTCSEASAFGRGGGGGHPGGGGGHPGGGGGHPGGGGVHVGGGAPAHIGGFGGHGVAGGAIGGVHGEVPHVEHSGGPAVAHIGGVERPGNVGREGGIVGREGGFGREGGIVGREGGFGREGGVGGREGGTFGREGALLGRGAFAGGVGLGGRGGLGGGFGGYGTRYMGGGMLGGIGDRIRGGYYPYFGRGWFGGYPGSWFPGLWWGGLGAWGMMGWGDMAPFLGIGGPPIDYDYGSTAVINDGQVYVNGESVAPEAQYASQAVALQDAGCGATPGPNDQWAPIGVFGLVQGNETVAQRIIELAANKAGVVRGNYYDAVADANQPICGQVDPKSQRVVWSVGNRKDIVFDAGLNNLLQQQTTVLIHYGTARTIQMVMVRLNPPQQPGQPGQPPPAPNQPPPAPNQPPQSLPPPPGR